MSSFRRSAAVCATGALLALPLGLFALLVIGLVLRTTIGPGPSFLKILVRFSRAIPILLAAGAVSGLITLREASPASFGSRVRQLLAFSYVTIPLALVFAITFGALQYAHFWFLVLRPRFDQQATDLDVRSRLGDPSHELRTPEAIRSGALLFSVPPGATRALTYSDRRGGTYRVLYFDSSGHFLSDETGHVW